MAAHEKGREKVASSPHTRRCEYEKPDGSGCRAWAVRNSEPPRCYWHSLSPAQQAEQVSRGGHASVAVRRAKNQGRARSGLRPGVSLQQVMDVCADLLTAEEPVIEEPNYVARALGALVLISLFPREFRTTPEKAREALQRALPPDLEQDEEEARRASAQRAVEAARGAWLANTPGVRYAHGYFDKWPEMFVLNWEDKAALDRQLQAHLKKEAEERPRPH